LVDATLRHVLVADQAREGGAELVQLQELQMRIAPGGEPQDYRGLVRVTLADPALAAALRRAAGGERLRVLPTWPVAGGRVLDVAGEGWRIFSPLARRLPGDLQAGDFMRLQPAAAGSPCARLAEALVPVPGRRLRMLDADAYCLAIYRASSAAGAPDAEDGTPSEELAVWVYPKPSPTGAGRLAERPLLPLAAVDPYARLDARAADDAEWALGQTGPWAGWLTLGDARGGAGTIGLPLSTCALWRLGRDAVPAAAASAGGRPAPSTACTGR
jgi:hypothetical protein